MFDLAWQEILLIGAVALVVIGPKDLPRAVRSVAGWVRKGRELAREFQTGVDEMVRQADLDDIKTEIAKSKLGSSVAADLGLNEIKDGLQAAASVINAPLPVPPSAMPEMDPPAIPAPTEPAPAVPPVTIGSDAPAVDVRPAAPVDKPNG